MNPGRWLAASWLAASTPLGAAELLRVGLADGCQLQADIRRDERAACWRLACPGSDPRQLVCDASALHQLTDALPSADQRWLAVSSVGEGHPWLEIVDLAALRARGDWRVRCELNPYPGTIGIDAWYGGELGLWSDVDLREPDSTARAGAIGDELRAWQIDPRDCSL